MYKNTMRYFPLLLLCVCSLLPTACRPAKVDQVLLDRYTEAKSLYLAGELDQAEKRLRAIREEAPRFWNNTFMLGKVYFFKEEYASAESAWREVLVSNPSHIDSVKWLSRLYLLQSQAGEAEPWLEQALSLSSDDPELLLLLAKVRRASGDFATAIELLEKAGLFKDRMAEAHLELFEIYRTFGMVTKAKGELDTALSYLDPDSSLYEPLSSLRIQLEEEEKP